MVLEVWGEISGAQCLVGRLETIPGREEQFAYASSFLERDKAQPLSISLPLQEEPFPAKKTRAFFRNLLPEGTALAAAARALEVKSSSYLKVLSALGNECIGALILRNSESRDRDPYGYDPLSREKFEQSFSAGPEGVAELQGKARLSLAGAQSKMGLYVQQQPGKQPLYYVPQGSAASTHIVKTANRRFEQLSENECYCLRLAAASGLSVPECFLDSVGGQSLFVVKRFDRKPLPCVDQQAGHNLKQVQRLHQEDFCQVLGLLPESKYEAKGMRYAKMVRNMLYEHSTNPIQDLSSFLRMLAVNAMLGNCDGHLKNLTILRGADWSSFSLAPAYDIASTVVYAGLDRRMAMAIGTTSEIDKVSRDDFMALAKELSVSTRLMGRLLDEVCEGIAGTAPSAAKDMEDELGKPLSKVRKIETFAKRQAKALSK